MSLCRHVRHSPFPSIILLCIIHNKHVLIREVSNTEVDPYSVTVYAVCVCSVRLCVRMCHCIQLIQGPWVSILIIHFKASSFQRTIKKQVRM